jgi:hypothetical protein
MATQYGSVMDIVAGALPSKDDNRAIWTRHAFETVFSSAVRFDATLAIL